MKLILLTFLLSLSSTIVNCQERADVCVTNHNEPPVSSYYWPPDTTVKVHFIRAMFSPEQTDALLTAMKAWSDVSAQVGAGISFVYAGEVDGVMNCHGCLTVTRREVYKNDRKHYAFFNPLAQRADGLLISARIDFDFATTKPQALQGFMAHELGHGMGLWDCTTCKKKQTIMNGFPGINKDNGFLEPSICDQDVVRSVYQLQRRVSSNTVRRPTQERLGDKKQ